METLEPGSQSPFQVTVLRDCENPTVDIIAVSALGVESSHAWSHAETIDGKKTGRITNWLQDDNLLPKEIPTARVLSVCFDRDWLAKTDSRFWDLGTKLMGEIHLERETSRNEKAKQRPIIFIGHSLSGLVIEQGLVNASSSTSLYTLIPKCTVGIVCLGTPHGGTSAEEWRGTIIRVTKAFRVDEGLALVQNLGEGMDAVMNTTHQFMTWVSRHSVELFQFFEAQKTKYGSRYGLGRNEVLVPENLACLPGFPRAQLETNHLKLAHYKGPNDASYLRVISSLHKMANVAPKMQKLRFETQQFIQDNSQVPAVHLECQKALFVSWPKSEFGGIKRRLGDRSPGTCEWILSKQVYTQWFLGEWPQVLRITGQPAMGKSMLTTFLIDHLTAQLGITPQMALAYHFCDNRNNSSNTATAVVRQILFQLYQQWPKHFHLLQKVYDIQGAMLFSDFDTLWRVLVQTLESHLEGEAFILIDALDECDEQSRSLLIEGLQDIARSNLNVRILFTCQPEDDIERAFRDHNTQAKTLQVESSDIEDDLLKYLKDKIPKLCERQGWGDKEAATIQRAMARSNNGTYSPWFTAIRDLETLSSRARISEILDKLPVSEASLKQDKEEELEGPIQDMEAAEAEREKKVAELAAKRELEMATNATSLEGEDAAAAPEAKKTSDGQSQPTEQRNEKGTDSRDQPNTVADDAVGTPKDPAIAEEDDAQAASSTDNSIDFSGGPTGLKEVSTDDGGHWYDRFSKAPKTDETSGNGSEGEEYRISNLDALPRGPPIFEDIVAPGLSRSTLIDGAGTFTASGSDAISGTHIGGLRKRPVAAAARYDFSHLRMDTGAMLPVVEHSQQGTSLFRWRTVGSQASTAIGRTITVVRARIFPSNTATAPGPSTTPSTPSSPLSDLASNYTLQLEVSTYLLSPTATVSMIGIAIASGLLAIGVYKLFKKEARPDYEAASWDDSDFYLGASNNCWLFLAAIFSLIMTAQHVREHTNYLVWLAVWVFSGLCIIMCALGIALYTKSPAWCQLLAGTGNALQVLIIFLSIRIMEKTRQAETPVRQRIKLLVVQIREKDSKCEVLERQNMELMNHVNTLRNGLAANVEKPMGTYQLKAVLNRSLSGGPGSVENAEMRAAREISPYT